MQQFIKNFLQIISVYCLILCVTGCTRKDSADLTITSNSQYLELSEHLGRSFKQNIKTHSNTEQGQKPLRIIVKGTLGQELTLLKKNLTDIIITDKILNNTDINIKNLESRKLGQAKIHIIVNQDNSLVNNLYFDSTNKYITQESLQKIFSGEYKQWQIINREPGSNVRQIFEQYYLQNNIISLNAIAVNSHSEMKSAIKSMNNSIGYTSHANFQEYATELYIQKNKTILATPTLDLYAYWLKTNDNIYFNKFQKFLDTSVVYNILQEQGFTLDK